VEIELTGDNMWAAAPSIARACLYLSAGRLDDAAEEAEVARVIASGLGHEFFVLVTECVQALIALRRGDVPEAAERMDRCAARIPSSSGAVDPASYSWTRAHVAAAQGDAAGALQALAFPHDGVPTHDWLLVELPAEVAWSVRTALKAEATEQAEALVAHAEDAAARNPELTTIVASALHARGLLDRDSEALVQAAAKEVHPWQRGSAHEDEGVILAEAHRDGARAALERACGAYEEAGAMGDADRVRERLRDLLHTGRRRHDERPRWGWSSLTPTEREVARNVAEGLTNARVGEKMFLSRHTVDFHLRQIYRKLDITSRVELTRLVLKYEGDSPVTPSPYSKQP
jgi:DNA-binding CsgD family transcriptional regulator